jgi:hypothetical protein
MVTTMRADLPASSFFHMRPGAALRFADRLGNGLAFPRALRSRAKSSRATLIVLTSWPASVAERS